MPTFLDYQQAVLLRMSPDMWVWSATGSRLFNDQAAIDYLTERGFEHVEIEGSYLTCLSSQGYETHILDTPQGDHAELWVRREDAQAIQQQPVVLTFQFAGEVTQENSQEQTAAIPMLQFLPPATVGSSAIIFRTQIDTTSYVYSIEELPETAQRLHSELAHKLVDLAGGIDHWYQWHDGMRSATNPVTHDKILASLRNTLLLPSFSERD